MFFKIIIAVTIMFLTILPVFSQSICPKCGKEMKEEWKLCPYDGTIIKKENPVSENKTKTPDVPAPKTANKLEYLITQLKNKNLSPQAREVIIKELQKDNQYIKPLMVEYKNADDTLKIDILRIFPAYGYNEETFKIMTAALNKNNSKTLRETAVNALGETKRKEAVEPLGAMILDEEIRGVIMGALLKIDDESILKHLKKIFLQIKSFKDAEGITYLLEYAIYSNNRGRFDDYKNLNVWRFSEKDLVNLYVETLNTIQETEKKHFIAYLYNLYFFNPAHGSRFFSENKTLKLFQENQKLFNILTQIPQNTCDEKTKEQINKIINRMIPALKEKKNREEAEKIKKDLESLK